MKLYRLRKPVKGMQYIPGNEEEFINALPDFDILRARNCMVVLKPGEDYGSRMIIMEGEFLIERSPGNLQVYGEFFSEVFMESIV